MTQNIKQLLESDYLSLADQGKTRDFIEEHGGIKIQITNYGDLQGLRRATIPRVLSRHDNGYFYIFPDQENLTRGFVVPVIWPGNNFGPMMYSILRTLFDIKTAREISEDFRISRIDSVPLYLKVNDTWVGNELGSLTVEGI